MLDRESDLENLAAALGCNYDQAIAFVLEQGFTALDTAGLLNDLKTRGREIIYHRAISQVLCEKAGYTVPKS